MSLDSRSPCRLDASTALEGLRALGLSYRPDLRQPDGAWIARCPCCAAYTDKPTLHIFESRRGGPVSLSCSSRLCSRDEIALKLREALLPLVDGEQALALAEDACDVVERALELVTAQLDVDPEPLAVAV
jgi:hypothetical protein